MKRKLAPADALVLGIKGSMRTAKKRVRVNDKMQRGYAYTLTAPAGKKFDPRFKPELSPKAMLALGVFGGVYMRDCTKEFPKDWFTKAKFQKPGVYTQDPKLNYFGVKASQPLSVWRAKGWIYKDDPRGWFQWYCRYYMGRRLPEEDARQIKRWLAMRRHVVQLRAGCRKGDTTCHPRQRQALLHGSYVLDFVAKTHVAEIHIFDRDVFLSHNAFRTPGAAAIEILRGQPRKVEYLHDTYSRMRKGVIPHEYRVEEAVADELAGMSFVFVCVDDSDAKKEIFEKLAELRIPFIDVGMGVNEIDGLLTGSARVTLVTPNKNDHVERRVSLSERKDDDYSQNVQIAELNALNAALAVIKWKKLFGFYHDLSKEHNAIYDISVNKVINDENSA